VNSTAWILILFLQWDRGGGAATAEFATEQLCVSAGQAAMTKHGGNARNSWYACVPKGKP